MSSPPNQNQNNKAKFYLKLQHYMDKKSLDIKKLQETDTPLQKEEEESKDDEGTKIVRFDREISQMNQTKEKFMQNWESLAENKMRVRLKCPSCENKAKPIAWNHLACGTAIYIEETGYLSCEKNCTKFFIQKAKFKCSQDHGVEYTQYTNLADLLQPYMHGIESIKNGIVDQSKLQQFILVLMVNISNNWERFATSTIGI